MSQPHLAEELEVASWPRDHTRPDASKRAQGLAAHARDLGPGLGHIELIAKIGGRLHLKDEKTRKAWDIRRSIRRASPHTMEA